jgi:Protein of unknown function (DUF1360)
MSSDLADALDDLEEDYAPDEDRPLGSYAGVMAVHAGVVAAGLFVAARTGRLPRRMRAADLGLVAVATHKLSRLLAKDPVTSPLRAPFTRFKGTSGPSELKEEVRGTGVRHAVGELVTCPFCLGQWVATGFCLGLVFAPEPTRVVASILAVHAGSDALQFAYDRLQS